MKSSRGIFLFAILLSTFLAVSAGAYTMPYPYDFTDTSARTEVDCTKVLQGKTMVALVFGQSNSANFGQTRHKPKKNVYNFWDGKCYVAEDPLLGTDGSGGTVWSRLSEKLVERGLVDNVLLVAVGVGGTEMRRWTVTGDLNRRLPDVLRQLKKKNIRITHMLWHQGESDYGRGTKKDDYKLMFMTMLKDLRRRGVDAPIYVAVATRCGGKGMGLEIQQAQRELVNTELGIYPGADSDTLDLLDDRHDACHFSTSGLDKHAELWYNAILYSGK